MTRCKMTLTGKTDTTQGDGKEVTQLSFSPVIDGSEENKKFFAATPGGSLTLGVVNKAAVEGFEQGKQYYIDISPAE